jgi:hypothetical protein
VSDQSNVPSKSFVAIPSSKLHEGKWTQDKHEAFFTGRTKYGNKWTKIATTIQIQTVIQIKRHAQIYDQFKKNKKAAAVLQYRKSLTPEKKGRIVKSDTAAHTKKCESLSPEKKAHMLEINAAEQEKYCKSLLPEKKSPYVGNPCCLTRKIL